MAFRKQLSKHGSKKLFNKTAKKTHKQNSQSVTAMKARGGKRL